MDRLGYARLGRGRSDSTEGLYGFTCRNKVLESPEERIAWGMNGRERDEGHVGLWCRFMQ